MTNPELNLSQLAACLEELGMLSEKTHVASAEAYQNVKIFGAAHDSRAVLPGNVFICKGVAFKPAFLPAALEKGAVA